MAATAARRYNATGFLDLGLNLDHDELRNSVLSCLVS